MASLTMTPTYILHLSSAEMALIQKGLEKLQKGDGTPLPSAVALRDLLVRQRALRAIQQAEQGQEALSRLPPSVD